MSGYNFDGALTLTGDFVIGDREGTTADPRLSKKICAHLEGLGYSASYNHPYKGVELVRRHAGQIVACVGHADPIATLTLWAGGHEVTPKLLQQPLAPARGAVTVFEYPFPYRATPEYLGAFVKSEIEKWAAPIKASGARVE